MNQVSAWMGMEWFMYILGQLEREEGTQTTFTRGESSQENGCERQL